MSTRDDEAFEQGDEPLEPSRRDAGRIAANWAGRAALVAATGYAVCSVRQPQTIPSQEEIRKNASQKISKILAFQFEEKEAVPGMREEDIRLILKADDPTFKITQFEIRQDALVLRFKEADPKISSEGEIKLPWSDLMKNITEGNMSQNPNIANTLLIFQDERRTPDRAPIHVRYSREDCAPLPGKTHDKEHTMLVCFINNDPLCASDFNVSIKPRHPMVGVNITDRCNVKIKPESLELNNELRHSVQSFITPQEKGCMHVLKRFVIVHTPKAAPTIVPENLPSWQFKTPDKKMQKELPQPLPNLLDVAFAIPKQHGACQTFALNAPSEHFTLRGGQGAALVA